MGACRLREWIFEQILLLLGLLKCEMAEATRNAKTLVNAAARHFVQARMAAISRGSQHLTGNIACLGADILN